MKRTITLLLLLLFVLMMNNAKSQQWTILYDKGDDADYILICGDNSGKYEYFAGSRYDNVSESISGLILCVDENGNYTEKFTGNEGEVTYLNALHGLDDEKAFVAGMCSDNGSTDIYNKLWVSVLNPELDILNEKYIELGGPYITYLNAPHLLINNDNEIVLLLRVADEYSYQTGFSCDYAFYVFDEECNLLRSEYLKNDAPNSEIDDFTLVPNTNNYAIYGDGIEGTGLMNVVYVDEEFNVLSVDFIEDVNDYPNLMLPIRLTVDQWCDENHFLISAQSPKTNGTNTWRPFVIKMDTDMNLLKVLDFERVDTTDYVMQYKNMSYVNPDRIYIATFLEKLSDTPTEINIYLINDRLDLLGMKKIYAEGNYFGLHTHATTDGDCILLGRFRDGDFSSLIHRIDVDEFEVDVDVVMAESGYEVTCFPNPVSSSLNIDLHEVMNRKAKISIVDMMGRRYLDKEIFLDGNILSIDVSPLESGTYTYNIVVDEKCICKDKFVKN